MNRRILLIAAAVVLALLGTFAVYSYGKNADKRAVANVKGTSVLVATKQVPAGTTWADAVKSGNFKTETVQANNAPADALAGTANAAIGNDAVAEFDIAPGQIVMREAFGTKTSTTGVLTIPKGMIAISVAMPANADAAGYISPGSDVIIFATAFPFVPGTAPTTGAATPKSGSTSTAATVDPALKHAVPGPGVNQDGGTLTLTKTVIPKALVLATSQAAPTAVTANSTSANTTSTGSTVLVTLALSQSDAERMLNQQTVGTLYMGLLSSTSVVTADPGVTNTGAYVPVPVYVK